jgi:hypothetical protein
VAKLGRRKEFLNNLVDKISKTSTWRNEKITLIVILGR